MQYGDCSDECARAKEKLGRIAKSMRELAIMYPPGTDTQPSLHTQSVYKKGWADAVNKAKDMIGDLSEWALND